jgi:hypothetical protein
MRSTGIRVGKPFRTVAVTVETVGFGFQTGPFVENPAMRAIGRIIVVELIMGSGLAFRRILSVIGLSISVRVVGTPFGEGHFWSFVGFKKKLNHKKEKL